MQRPKRTPHSTRTENSSRLTARSLFDRSCLARPELEGRRTCLAASILLSGRLRGELPSREANRCAGRVLVSAHMAEQEPVRRDADRLVPASDPHLRPADTQRAVLGMDSEDLWHGPHLRPRRRRRSMTSMQASWLFAQVVVPRYHHGEELGRRAPTASRPSAAWGGSALGASSGKGILAAG